jgi:hypothetical protein
MKKFIWKSFIFFLGITLLYNLLAIIVKPTTRNDYMAAIIDKHKRITELNKPKIIFTGGSNLVFGLNSEEIEKEFSVPVVNLALHAGLGLDFILEELKDSISSGDLLFISTAYFLDSKGIYALKKNASDFFDEAHKYYDKEINLKRDIQMHIDKTRRNLKEIVYHMHENNVYSREAFNKYGDVTAHLDKSLPEVLKDTETMTYKYWEGINELNKFYKYANSKNVKVFYIYPNYALSEFEKNRTVIEKFEKDMTDNLEFEILNRPHDSVFEDDLFFDTVYHLNKKGREMRTKRLIELIKKNTNAQQCIYAIRGNQRLNF